MNESCEKFYLVSTRQLLEIEGWRLDFEKRPNQIVLRATNQQLDELMTVPADSEESALRELYRLTGSADVSSWAAA